VGSPAPGLPTVEVANRLGWLGHSTVFVELDDTRLLTDPLLRRRVFHLLRDSPVGLEDIGALDGVLISHIHYDHLDLPSLRRLPRDTTIVAPRGAGRLLGRRGFTSVVETAVGEETPLGSLVVRAVPAIHTSRRVLGSRTEALGYLIAGSKRIYFPGDTDLFPGMADLAPVEVAFIPIWGWGPTLGPRHLDPRTGAEALRLIEPRVAVPIHWGTYYPLTFALRKERPFLRAPADSFAQAAAELAPEVEIRILPPGGTLSL